MFKQFYSPTPYLAPGPRKGEKNKKNLTLMFLQGTSVPKSSWNHSKFVVGWVYSEFVGIGGPNN